MGGGGGIFREGAHHRNFTVSKTARICDICLKKLPVSIIEKQN